MWGTDLFDTWQYKPINHPPHLDITDLCPLEARNQYFSLEKYSLYNKY